jgi:hypothetical protein
MGKQINRDSLRFFAEELRRKQFYELLRLGASRSDAAAKLGTCRRTVWNECDRDAEFKIAVEQAEAEGKIFLITCIREAAPKDWRAALAMLQAKYFEWSKSAHDATPNKDLLKAHRLLGETLRGALASEHHAAVQSALDGYLEGLLLGPSDGDDHDGD